MLHRSPRKNADNRKVKVAVREGEKTHSQIVSVESGKAEVKLEVNHKKSLQIAVGPANASDEDIFRLRTLTASVSPQQWEKEKALTLAPIAITPIYWRWWWIWCRGVPPLLVASSAPDGSPVPECRSQRVRRRLLVVVVVHLPGGQHQRLPMPTATSLLASAGAVASWWPWWWWETTILEARSDPSGKNLPGSSTAYPELGVRQPSTTRTLFDLVSLKPQVSRTTGTLVKPTTAASQGLSPGTDL